LLDRTGYKSRKSIEAL